MAGLLPRFLRIVLDHLPSRTRYGTARRLILRANAARDARQWQVASVLYEEALQTTPTSRIHKQCGHMFKESGQFDAAEHHYKEAERLDPNDADLAFQIGHFEKVRGDLPAAEASYRRALNIKPGWNEPQDELSKLSSAIGEQEPISAMGLVPELLPTVPPPSASYRETIQIRRLGRIARISTGYKRVIQGIEAIRGFCITSDKVTEVIVVCAGKEMARYRPSGLALPGGYLKHAFNIWLDFSNVPRGGDVIELRFVGRSGRWKTYRTAVEIIDPVWEADHPRNDSVVDPPEEDCDLTTAINARPSIARSANRAPLPRSIKTIFVQRIDQLGDLIVSVSALRRIRELFADAHITLIVSPANADFAHTLDMIDEVLTVKITSEPDGRRAVPFVAQETLRSRLAGRRFDLAIDLAQGSESRALLQLPNAAFTYGFRTATSPWLSASFDMTAPDPFNGLETCSPSRKLLAMVDAIGRMHETSSSPASPSLDQISSKSQNPSRPPYVILHAGARLAMNRWPHFGNLIQLLLEATSLNIVLMGANLPATLVEHDRIRVINEILPFPEFDLLLSGCSVFVGNDSGPKHLAAVRGAPTISLHLARLNWSEWGQEGNGTVISRRVPCAGCAIENDASECAAEFACLTNIRPSEVLTEIIRLNRSAD